jgi:hypothetical protein
MAADLILVVDHGEIVERGTHEELLLKGGKYWELWTKQTMGKSGTPSSVDGEAKKEDMLGDGLAAGEYTQQLNRAFGVGAQQAEDPPLVVVTPADDEETGEAGTATDVEASSADETVVDPANEGESTSASDSRTES